MTTFVSKLLLGTAQFGLNYGLSNTDGQTSPEMIRKILTYANGRGLRMLDTAFQYGNAEEVLGREMGIIEGWDIVTKSPKFRSNEITDWDAQQLENAFYESRKKLNQNSIYGLLIHSADDLLKPGGQKLVKSLCRLKDLGVVKKTGVSIYNAEQIDRLLDVFPMDLIQVPFSILDQRLLESGHLQKLKKLDVEIHARSVFLQGLLLMKLSDIPSFFNPIRDVLKSFFDAAQSYGLTPLQLALGFAYSVEEIDRVVVGLNSLEQLEDIVEAGPVLLDISDFGGLAIFDPLFVNPSGWKV